MTPLSIEYASRGNPAMFHAWILIGSPSVVAKEKLEEQGIFRSLKAKKDISE